MLYILYIHIFWYFSCNCKFIWWHCLRKVYTSLFICGVQYGRWHGHMFVRIVTNVMNKMTLKCFFTAFYHNGHESHDKSATLPGNASLFRILLNQHINVVLSCALLTSKSNVESFEFIYSPIFTIYDYYYYYYIFQ